VADERERAVRELELVELHARGDVEDDDRVRAVRDVDGGRDVRSSGEQRRRGRPGHERTRKREP
jgi:hypothetical protein